MRQLLTLPALIAAILVGLYLGACYVVPPTPDVAWIYELYRNKLAIVDAHKNDERRIFIVGGSDALYQVSAEQIERELGFPTINLGTHAMLGWKTLLDLAAPFPRKGDVVVYIANIYSIRMPYPAPLAVRYRRYAIPFWFIREPVATWPDYLASNIMDDAARRLFEGRARALARSNADLLNANGDTTTNIVGANYVFAKSIPNPGKVPTLTPSAPGFGHLKAFRDLMKARGVKVFVNWHGILASDAFNMPDQRAKAEIIQAAAEHWQFDILNRPLETTYSLHEIFNGALHPNSIGRERYTSLLISRLRLRLKD